MDAEEQTPASCVVRVAVAEDARAIEGLYRELVADPRIGVEAEQIGAMARSGRAFLLVAEDGGEVVGCALLNLCEDAMYRAQPFGVVENMVVTSARRGRGLGRRLLDEIEQLAVTHRCTKLMLLSGEARHEAHAFFRACGFSGDTKQAFVKYRRQMRDAGSSDDV